MSREGIPTLYRGVQYRSRLEAKWAAFFDLLGWPFQYEPFDLAGWIPDFILLGSTEVLVEVKPVVAFPRDVAAEIDRACPLPTGEEADPVYDSREILIVGATLPRYDGNGRPCVGWLRQGDWAEAPFGAWSGRENAGDSQWIGHVFGFCHEFQSYADRITGRYDGGAWGELDLDEDQLLGLWNEAGNLVQWRGRRSVAR